MKKDDSKERFEEGHLDAPSILRKKGSKFLKESPAQTLERVKSLRELHASIENVGGTLAELSCAELDTLIENLRYFPIMRDHLDPEERATREALYKVAFLDKNLQAGLQTKQVELQTEIQRELLRELKSALTGQPTASVAGPGQSNLARNAAMIGGIAALHKLNQIEENTGDVSEGLGFD